MDTRTLITKLIILIFRTRQLEILDHDDLVRTIIGTMKIDTKEQKFLGKNNTSKLVDYVLKLLEEKEPIPLETIIPTLSILLEHDPKLLSVIKEAIEAKQDEGVIKRVIGATIKGLNNHYKEHLAIEVIGRMSYDLKFNRSKIGNFGTYLQNALSELEPLASMQTSTKDPAVVTELDIEVEETLTEVFEEVRNINSNNSIYKFGWQALNRMTQGGIRRGEFVTVGSLQHKYKTGLSLSMVLQIMLHNKPIVTKEEAEAGKKPLILRISFEDPLVSNLQFAYQYTKNAAGSKVTRKELVETPPEEMAAYIKKELGANGFHLKMMRVDPSQWSYIDVFNKVIEYEAKGYAVHVLALDYVGMLPTTGCDQSNPAIAFRDLLRRFRNFCSSRNTAFISPLQLSTEAKQLLRNGVPDHQFAKEVANLGYYDRSKSLDQEIDLELFLHTFTHRGVGYVSLNRGKHRLPTMVEEEDLFFMIPFPDRHSPLLPDLDTDDTSIRSLPRGNINPDQSDLLTEVLG